MKNIDIEKKLYTVKTSPDKESHLTPNLNDCKNCLKKPCIYACPASVYIEEENKITVRYENCLECGACKIVCPERSLGWRYPKPKCGITYKML